MKKLFCSSEKPSLFPKTQILSIVLRKRILSKHPRIDLNFSIFIATICITKIPLLHPDDFQAKSSIEYQVFSHCKSRPQDTHHGFGELKRSNFWADI